MPQIDNFLRVALENRASDLHFSSGEPVRLRIDGDLVSLDNNVIEAKVLQHVLFEILTDNEKQKFLESYNLDKSYSMGAWLNRRNSTEIRE